MPDEPNTPAPAPPAPEAAVVATPDTDPTPAQVESKSVVNALSSEIDDLWKQAAKPPAERTPREPEQPEAVAEPPAPEPAAEPAKAETTPPPPDTATLEQQAYERARTELAAQQDAERKAADRLASEQRIRQQQEAYIGAQADYDAVNAAIRAASAGDFTVLDALDVMLPNGKRVSEVKGDKGLTAEEAAGVLNAWDQARAYEDVMGDRKVSQILDYWNREVLAALNDPDVDAAAVTKHESPAKQMEALKTSIRDRVTKRLTEAHTAELAARDKTIAEQTERINSLVNERGNLVSQRTAAQTATIDRPGQPGGQRRDLPRTAEEIRAMSADDFFKSGTADRLLQAIPGGRSRRRTG